MSKRIVYTILIIIGLIMLEGPFILLANRIEPMILGMPFLLFWTLLWWFICTLVFFIAYQTNWGKK